MAEGKWTTEEQKRLGRSLQQWDPCPHCREFPRNHTYDPQTGDLRCLPPPDEREAARQLNDRLYQEGRQMTRQLFVADRTFWQAKPLEAAAKPKPVTPAKPTRNRRYFDGE